MALFENICLRKTTQFAAQLAIQRGFEWQTSYVDEVHGPTTVKGVIVPALDDGGAPIATAPVHWGVAAIWPGIGSMPDQLRLEELRDVTFACSAAHNVRRWHLSGARKKRWIKKVDAFHGTFCVLVPPHWGGYHGIAPV